MCIRDRSAIDNSDKKQSTKDNLHSTLAVLNDFRSGLDFKDLTYTFLRDFEQYLREKGNACLLYTSYGPLYLSLSMILPLIQ